MRRTAGTAQIIQFGATLTTLGILGICPQMTRTTRVHVSAARVQKRARLMTGNCRQSGSKGVCDNPREQQNAAVKRRDGADTPTPGDTNACQQTTESHSVVDSNCDKTCQTQVRSMFLMLSSSYQSGLCCSKRAMPSVIAQA